MSGFRGLRWGVVAPFAAVIAGVVVAVCIGLFVFEYARSFARAADDARRVTVLQADAVRDARAVAVLEAELKRQTAASLSRERRIGWNVRVLIPAAVVFLLSAKSWSARRGVPPPIPVRFLTPRPRTAQAPAPVQAICGAGVSPAPVRARSPHSPSLLRRGQGGGWNGGEEDPHPALSLKGGRCNGGEEDPHPTLRPRGGGSADNPPAPAVALGGLRAALAAADEVDVAFVDELVARVGRGRDAAVPLLQAIQSHYGYLPDAALRRVCELTEITPAQIAGVSTFYAQFRRSPVGRHVVKVCHGTACHVSGARQITDEIRRHLALPPGADTDPQRLFTIDEVACLGCCSLAPVIMIGTRTAGQLTPTSACAALDEVRQEDAG